MKSGAYEPSVPKDSSILRGLRHERDLKTCVIPAPLCCQEAGCRASAAEVFLAGVGAGSVVGAGPGSG